MLRRVLPLLCASLLIACSDSDDAPTPVVEDTGSAIDSASPVDTGVAVDSAVVEDSAPADSTAVDSAEADAAADTAMSDSAMADTAVPPGDGGSCHGITFGAPAAPIRKVASLPTMTGGTIVPGIYDATDSATTGTLSGTYRATWFISASEIAAIEQTTISAPGPITPRTLSWSTAGIKLTRTQICGGTESFTNDFTVRTESGTTYLDVRSGNVMFTFIKR